MAVLVVSKDCLDYDELIDRYSWTVYLLGISPVKVAECKDYLPVSLRVFS
jgi:hypothetical protein